MKKLGNFLIRSHIPKKGDSTSHHPQMEINLERPTHIILVRLHAIDQNCFLLILPCFELFLSLLYLFVT
jgi:hypothetical protein